MNQALATLRLRTTRTSLADSVYEALLEAIIEGRLAAGAEVNAVALASQLDVSRTPVQEAIHRLEAHGLIVNPLGKKARVTKFSLRDITEVCEVRALLEAKAAALTAKRIASDQLAGLGGESDAWIATRSKLNWLAEALHFDLHFHDVVAAASGNSRLRNDIHRYRLPVRSL
jgi:DNA-binding GntR family transcriptional regulator